jgi:replicative superfamily II helicase
VTQLRAGLKTQDINVLELSEKVAVSTNEISQGNIIVTTPGKLDVYTQRSPELWAKVQLLIVEDLQQLGENQAGSALERVMARLQKALYSFKTRDQREDFRTVGFSSIVKNYKKLADYFFQAKLVIGIPHSESPVRWNFKFIEPKLEVVAELAPHELCLEELNSLLRNDKNVVVVVQNKREAEIFTKYILKQIDFALLKKGFVQKPRDRIENEDLYSNFYQKRVAYFHGGMK